MVVVFGTMEAREARAQHSHTIGIVSDAANGGNLKMVWDFDGKPVARVYDQGIAGVFQNNVPGLNDATGNGVDTFTLMSTPTATQVEIELTAADGPLEWIFGGGTLTEPGDKALLGTMPNLHNHATFRLTGDSASNQEFLESRASFRVQEVNTAVGYGPSEVRTLRVSNGYLPPLATLATPDENKAQIKCQKAVASAVRSFIGKEYQLISKCMDAVLAHLHLSKSAAAALKSCSLDTANDKSLVSAIAAAKAKAVAGVAKKCGGLSAASIPYTESQVHTHLGMAGCRAQEMVGASYNQAAEMIGEVLEAAGAGDHHDVIEALPCMKFSHD